MLILIVEPFWKEERRRNVGWLTAVGLFFSIIISLIFGQPSQPTSVLGGMIRFDWLGFFFKLLFLFSGAITTLPFIDHEKAGRRGASYLLPLASALGLNLMPVSSSPVHPYPSIA